MNPPPELLFPLMLVGFVAFFNVIVLLISVIGGWGRLAERYRRQSSIAGTTWWLQSASVHGVAEVNYGSCLTVTVNDEGIGLSVLFPFRLGNPPLFIPWADIQVIQVRRWFFFNRVRLTIVDEPSLWIEISPRLADKIQQAIGQEWFDEAE